MLIRQAWYAVAFTSEVEDRPLETRLHGRPIVIFRNQEGKLGALHGHCPHRGASLAGGRVCGDVVECPFHGWQFDANGRCRKIPANPKGTPIPPRFRTQAFLIQERAGLVWVWGDEPKPDPSMPVSSIPLNLFPELDDPEFVKVPLKTTWNAHFTRSVESAIDVSHLPFVHVNSTGDDVDPAVWGPRYTVNGETLIIHPSPFRPAHPMEPPAPPDTHPEEQTEIVLTFPNCWIIRAPMGDGALMSTFLTFTPVDSQSTVIFGYALRNFGHGVEFLDDHHLSHTIAVMAEDQAVLERIRPAAAPLDLNAELHVPSDAPTIRFRYWLKQALRSQV